MVQVRLKRMIPLPQPPMYCVSNSSTTYLTFSNSIWTVTTIDYRTIKKFILGMKR